MKTSFKPQRNPYIIGRPIDQQLFFGRENLFSSIKDDLRHDQQVIIIYGQRRIGKSSIIRNIPNKFQDLDEFVFVTFSLEYYSHSSLNKILADLAQEIVNNLLLDDESIKLPESIELELDNKIFAHQFLFQVHQKLENKNLVLIFDEFDALINSNYSEALLQEFSEYFSSLIKVNKQLFIILFVEQRSVNKPIIRNTFKDVPIRPIELIDENSTKNLIVEPAKDLLEYEESAIKTIFSLTAGHPYFTQAICFAIFGRARENDNWKVSSEDIEAIISKAIELAEAGLAWFWDGFSTPEKVIFAAIAEAQETSEDYLKVIENFRPATPNELIIATQKQLIKDGFLDDTGRKIKIEIVRRWVLQNHPLREEIRKLEQFEKKKHR